MTLLSILSDATPIDPTAAAFKSLLDHWPWLAVMTPTGAWLAKYVVMPLTQRQISFMDGMESRERDRLQNDITMGAALSGISDRLVSHGTQLTEIRDTVKQPQCKAHEIASQQAHRVKPA